MIDDQPSDALHDWAILRSEISKLEAENERLREALSIMRLLAEHELQDSVWYTFSGEVFWKGEHCRPLPQFFVNCSDLFAWDAEEITPADLPALKKAIADIAAIDDTEMCMAPILFACRKRGLLPQKPVLEKIDGRILPLFKAEGREGTGE